MSFNNGNIQIAVNFNLAKALGGTFGTSNVSTNFTGSSQGLQISLTPGSGANQCNNVIAGGLTATTGGVSINLTDGSALMPDGTASNFADIVTLVVRNNGSTVVTVGGGTNAVTSIGSIPVAPGAIVVIECPVATGYAVTATTACIVKFTSASSTDAVDYMIAGH